MATQDRFSFKFVDYIDLVPGTARTSRLDADERERLKKAAEQLKEIANKHGVEFKITKGDER
jgi:hypothetical protein